MSAIFGSLISAFRAARRSLDVLNPSSASADSTGAANETRGHGHSRDQHDSYGDDSYDDEDDDEDDDEPLPPISNMGRSLSASPTRRHRRRTSATHDDHEQQPHLEGREGFASASSSSPINASRGKPRFLPYTTYPKQSPSPPPPPRPTSPARSSSTTPKSSRASAAASRLHISTSTSKSASPPALSPPTVGSADSAAHTYYLLRLSPTLLSLARLWFQGSTTVLIPLEPSLQAILGESDTELIAKLAHRAKKYASYDVSEGNEVKRVKAAGRWLYQGDWVEVQVKVEGKGKGKGKLLVVECVDVSKYRKASMAWIAHDHLTDLLVEVGKVDIRRVPEGLLVKDGMSLFIPHAKIRIDAHHPLLMSPRKSPASPTGSRSPTRAPRPTSPLWSPSPSSALKSPARPAYRRASVAPPPLAPPRSPLPSASAAGGIKRGYGVRRAINQDSDDEDEDDEVKVIDASDREPQAKRPRRRTSSMELPNQSRIASPAKPVLIDSGSSSSASSESASESEHERAQSPPPPAPAPPAPKQSMPRARRSKPTAPLPPAAAAASKAFRRPTTAPIAPRPTLAAHASSSSLLQKASPASSPVRPRTATPPANGSSSSTRSRSGRDIVIEVPAATPRPATRKRTRSQLATQAGGGGHVNVNVQDVRQRAMELVREIGQEEREIRELAGRVGVDVAVGLKGVLEMDLGMGESMDE